MNIHLKYLNKEATELSGLLAIAWVIVMLILFGGLFSAMLWWGR